jgi:hypothetical protein
LRAGLVSGGGYSDCRSVVSDTAGAIRAPDWKRLGFERYFEMQTGNFIALAGYYMVICGVLAFGAHLLRRAIGIVVRLVRGSGRPSDQGKV